MTDGDATLSDLPTALNGKAKTYFAVIGFLWTALWATAGFAVGGASQAAALERHEEIPGHPVIEQRVTSMESRILDRLNSIDNRLARLEDRP